MYEFCCFKIKSEDGNYKIASALSVICSRNKVDNNFHYCVMADCYDGESELLFGAIETPEEAYMLVDEVCRNYPCTDGDYVEFYRVPTFKHPLYIKNF